MPTFVPGPAESGINHDGAPMDKPADSLPHQVEPWSPSSWTTKPIKQDAIYKDPKSLEKSLSKLQRLPELVTPTEIVQLKANLRDVALGKAFFFRVMSLVLVWGANKKVVRIGRMAGQYAKPRSSPTEMVDGKEIPSFRGDILNGYAIEDRNLDPHRLVDAYNHSAATLNFIRASLSSGIADLHSPMNWGLGHVRDPGLQERYSKIVDSISESLRFMRTIGADTADQLRGVDLYTSHEGLVLEYEQSLTRRLKDPSQNLQANANSNKNVDPSKDGEAWFNTSAHFLWIGDRTRQVDGAHVEFFRGIANPIGVKVGPTTSCSDLLELLRKLNPTAEVGKITLITRYGASKVRTLLSKHIRTVEDSEYARSVVWQCDPMHGNTKSTSTGIKTRQFTDIFSELQETLAVHQEEGSYLGGVHLELTGDAVTECTGGSEGLAEEDLSLNYTSFCDPRLNEKQALEMAFLVAGHFREGVTEK
ncbi:hypothetical protein DID88_005009 [Monilinia fructigena]|uniref:Phospho-2-dehydro-3-deoxyheptonate aldolase n=1 Tax=Monilinia fructigena TaxID=38457 RepID=A0A395IST2_9HELO|nr:hypothetical protein DID88_005009 [Monilinia fructigena]